MIPYSLHLHDLSLPYSTKLEGPSPQHVPLSSKLYIPVTHLRPDPPSPLYHAPSESHGCIAPRNDQGPSCRYRYSIDTVSSATKIVPLITKNGRLKYFHRCISHAEFGYSRDISRSSRSSSSDGTRHSSRSLCTVVLRLYHRLNGTQDNLPYQGSQSTPQKGADPEHPVCGRRRRRRHCFVLLSRATAQNKQVGASVSW